MMCVGVCATSWGGCTEIKMNGFSNNLMVIDLLRDGNGQSKRKFAIFIPNEIFNPFIAAN